MFEVSELVGSLWRLYQEQLELRPEDEYLRQHCQPGFLAGTVRVFEFYEPYLPASGRVLDACYVRPRGRGSRRRKHPASG